MASERQREANRRNGSKGGPKTEAGKQRSRLNSLKHGLSSSTLVVLPDEHEHEYEEILHGFRDAFQPSNAVEDALVLRLAQAHWRGLRSRAVERGILGVTADVQRGLAREIVPECPEHLNPHNAIAVGFMTMPPERWQMYLRYDTTISRDFFRTLDTLMRLRVGRSAKSVFPEPSDSGIRFVSQNSTNSTGAANGAATARERSQPQPRPAIVASPGFLRHDNSDAENSCRAGVPLPSGGLAGR